MVTHSSQCAIHESTGLRGLCPIYSFQNIQPSAPLDFSELDSALQQQERIMNVSQALASEASRKSKLVAG